MTYYEDYRIATGFNVALGSLTNIEGITPPGDEPFAAPKALPLYDQGKIAVRLNGLQFTRGYPNVQWFFSRMTYVQLAYLASTYCSGGLSGQVTIYTTLGAAAYSRMNAVINLPKPATLRSQYRYTDVAITFTRLSASS